MSKREKDDVMNGRGIAGSGASPPVLDVHPSSGVFDPTVAALPYLELSRVLLRAHQNAMAMVEANRLLSDSVRAIVRRQQDIAFELAEQVWGAKPIPGKPGAPEEREVVFRRAADAVREIGEALIDAQLSALRTLETRSAEGVRANG